MTTRNRTRIRKEATARLTDIETEEVSAVDRAANKRSFLVVKAATPPVPPGKKKPGQIAGASGDEQSAGDQPAAGKKKKVSATMKTALEEKIAALKTALEGADVEDGADEAWLEEFGVQKEEAETPAASGTEEKPEDVEKARLRSRLEDARNLLGHLLDGTAPSATAQPQAAPSPAATEAAGGEGDEAAAEKSDVEKRFGELNDKLRKAFDGVLSMIGSLDEKIEKVGSTRGDSQQVDLEKAERVKKREADVSWPLDMNSPVTKANTPVEKSFFTP